MPAWPGTLPAYVQENGFTEIPMPVSIESEMDIGPAKIRRRFTKAPKRFQCQMMMTGAQVTTFETFWETTLLGGVLPFDWVHPRTRVAQTNNVRFRNPRYQIGTMGGGGTCVVSFIIEIT